MHEFSILEYNGEPEIVLCQLKKNESATVNKDYTCDDERPVKKRKSETKKRKLEIENLNNVDHSDSNSELSNDFSEEGIVDFIEWSMDASVDEEGINEKTESVVENDSDIVGEIMERGHELNLEVNKFYDVAVLRDESNSELNTTFGCNGESMVIGDELEWDFNSNGDTNSHKGSNELREKDVDDFIKSLLNPEYLVTSDSDTQQDLLFPQTTFVEISYIV
ncbi:hypothetical protein M5689_005458 [Euphorbia peplus]|nr:hypothetical protein M5689_005458 [Euphorbia peplus]